MRFRIACETDRCRLHGHNNAAKALGCEVKKLAKHFLTFIVDCSQRLEYHSTESILRIFEACAIFAMLLGCRISVAGVLQEKISVNKRTPKRTPTQALCSTSVGLIDQITVHLPSQTRHLSGTDNQPEG